MKIEKEKLKKKKRKENTKNLTEGKIRHIYSDLLLYI